MPKHQAGGDLSADSSQILHRLQADTACRGFLTKYLNSTLNHLIFYVCKCKQEICEIHSSTYQRDVNDYSNLHKNALKLNEKKSKQEVETFDLYFNWTFFKSRSIVKFLQLVKVLKIEVKINIFVSQIVIELF